MKDKLITYETAQLAKEKGFDIPTKHYEAELTIEDMKRRIEEGENPEELLLEEGLEPDYIFDLI